MTAAAAINSDPKKRAQIVVVGAGFAGLSAVKALSKADADITLIDRRNHHLFQPLLYQVATAALSPNQIASPIRSIVRRQKNASVILDEALGVDREAHEVILRDRTVPYDFLVLATGARHAYFGKDAWEDHAPGLKALEDANAIRNNILLAFERAERAPPGPARDRALTFAIIGGGPTGVELAGAIAEISKRALACDFRRTRCSDPHVILIEAGPRLLPSFSPRISGYVLASLQKRGVDVRLGAPVSDIGDKRLAVAGETIDADTIIWAAGVRASPAADWLGASRDRAGRVDVRGDLSIEGAPEIFVIGDTASAAGADGKPVPGLAPAAKQQGAYVGRVIASRLGGKAPPAPFRYMDFGSLATIGRNDAVAEFGGVKLTGFFAWLFWCAIHIYFLIGFRNRIVVTLDWMWSYVTLERGARLITEPVGLKDKAPGAAAAVMTLAAE